MTREFSLVTFSKTQPGNHQPNLDLPIYQSNQFYPTPPVPGAMGPPLEFRSGLVVMRHLEPDTLITALDIEPLVCLGAVQNGLVMG